MHPAQTQLSVARWFVFVFVFVFVFFSDTQALNTPWSWKIESYANGLESALLHQPRPDRNILSTPWGSQCTLNFPLSSQQDHGVAEKPVWVAESMISFSPILSCHLTTICLAPLPCPSPSQDVWHPTSGMKSYGSTFSAGRWQQVSTWLAILGNRKFRLFVSEDKEGCGSSCWKGTSLHLTGFF